MKVYLSPTGLCEHAHAFKRISSALARYSPPSVKVVANQHDADLVVVYAISLDAMQQAEQAVANGQRYAIVQTNAAPTICPIDWWRPMWERAKVVWSYYSLDETVSFPFNFYHAPLGIDDVFKQPFVEVERNLVITTGYVHGPGAERAVEAWHAARRVGLKPVHVGPKNVEGAGGEHADEHVQPDDEGLAELYRRARFVVALRHVEGFELPAIEGYVCGAQPVVYSQPSTDHWLGCAGMSYVHRIPEDEDPTIYLNAIFADRCNSRYSRYDAIPVHDRKWAMQRFDWAKIVVGFWERLGAS